MSMTMAGSTLNFVLQLYVKGEFVGGADVLDEMVQSGEIKELFKK